MSPEDVRHPCDAGVVATSWATASQAHLLPFISACAGFDLWMARARKTSAAAAVQEPEADSKSALTRRRILGAHLTP
jgi:hypothetical protein